MARNNIEGRLAVLEAEVLRLRGEVERLNRPRDWRGAFAFAAKHPELGEVFEEAQRLRELDRRRTKPKGPRRKAKA